MQSQTPDLSPFCAAGVTYRSCHLKVQENISLRCIGFHPPGKNGLPQIIFLPGLASVMENFRGTLQGLTRKFAVHYLESREKSSSQVAGKVEFSIQAMADDLASFIEQAGLTEHRYILMGYSLGATTILESLSKLTAPPLALVLVEPNASFPFPAWLLFLARYASFLYHPLKPFLKWYLRTFKTDMQNDRELYELNRRILDAADPRKISAAVRSAASYRVRPDPATSFPPALVIGASKDKFHSFDDSVTIAAGIPGSTYLDLETNQRSHSSEVAEILYDFIKNIKSN